MGRRLTFSAFIFCFLFFADNIYADVGEKSGSFMKICPGAKPASMAGAYAGVSGDMLNFYYNPAGLSSLNGYKFSFSHAFWLGSMNYSNFTAGAPLIDGYVAFGVNGLFAGEIDKYDRHGLEVGKSYSPSDISVGLSYSRDLEKISAGAAIKYITSEIAGCRAETFALDMGIMKRFGLFNTGFSIQNISGEMKFRNEGYSLPTVVRLGITYPFEYLDFSMLSSLEANISDDAGFKMNAGLNVDYPVDEMVFSVRIGVKSYAEGLDLLSHFTAGFGVEYSDVVFDYAFDSYEDLGGTHRLSFGYRIGA